MKCLANGWKTVVAVTICLIHPLASQNPYPYPNDPGREQASSNTFYLTSNSDCSSQMKNIYGYEATVLGYDISSTDPGPSSCTIMLTSQTQFGTVLLSLYLDAMNIEEQGIILSIYDGQGQGVQLGSYDSRSSLESNRRYMTTSGDTVTFILQRQRSESKNFDIQIKVKPIQSGTDPGFENGYGSDFYFDKFPQTTIVGIIGGFYGFVLIICFIVVIYCSRQFDQQQKKWETHELATVRSRKMVDNRSHVSQSTNVWSSDMTKQRVPPSHYSVDDPYITRNRRPQSEDGSSTVFDHDDKFQQRKLMNEERDRDRARRRMATQNASFTDADDDEADNFKEKVITSRVKTNGHRRNQRPPSYEEAVSEHSSAYSTEEDDDDESEVTSSNESTRKKPLSSEDSRSSKSYSTTESETEESEDEDSRRGGARARRSKPKPKPKPKWKPKRERRSSDESAPSRRRHPQQPQPQQMPPVQPMAYGAYPPGQFVPVLAGHPAQFPQPVQMVPTYPPPHYPEGHPQNQPQQQVAPTEPPVYSYLVRRGYKPVDSGSGGRHSPASASGSQRSGGAHLEEPDLPLQSGVDYLRR